MAVGEPVPHGTHNMMSGGIVIGPMVMGRDVTVELPAAVPSALNGLHAGTSQFVGRGAILRELLDLLAPGAAGSTVVQVSAVAGLAGVGKTELALQAAHQALARGWFPGGALMVDLHGYEPEPKRLESGQALSGLLRALCVPDEHIPPGVQDRERLYRAILAEYAAQGRRILVVIDNASSGNQAAPLLPGAGAAIVTSRHTLADLDGRLLDLDVLSAPEAVDLLDRLLRLKRGDADTRVADDPGQARRLVEFCSGLPLAVAIVAALLAAQPAKPLARMAADLAAEHARPAELRYEQTAVRAAFDLSYGNLDDAQGRLFRLLTVNPGPEVSTEAAAILSGLEERPARRLLEELARAHLIEPAGVYGRWRMHDLVRLYASDLGEANAGQDDRMGARARLLEYYLTTSWNASSHLNPTITDPAAHGFGYQEQALAWLDAELPNLVAACRTGAELTPFAGMVMARSLGHYLVRRRRFEEWVELATLAVHASRRLSDRHAECKALGDLGAALMNARRFTEAITTCRDAVALCRETGDRRGEGMALGNMAQALREMRQPEEAMIACRDADVIFRETGFRREEGLALATLGGVLLQSRQFEEAVVACRDAAAILRETGDRDNEGTALVNLGLALVETHRFEEAVAACRDAIAIFRDTGNRHGEVLPLTNLGVALQELGRHEEAVTTHQDTVAMYRETDDRDGEGRALAHLGRALARSQRYEEAVTTCRDAVEILRETGDRHNEGLALTGLGVALHETHRLEEAITTTRVAVTILREVGDRHHEGWALINLGLDLMDARRFTEGIDACLDATAIFRETGDRDNEGTALANLRLVLGKMVRPGDTDPTSAFSP
ncbi:tetratricopeptide repeat protein [Streptomyces montanus]|nr:tetratricopeptide repeat protein [Streptomyces montanus]